MQGGRMNSNGNRRNLPWSGKSSAPFVKHEPSSSIGKVSGSMHSTNIDGFKKPSPTKGMPGAFVDDSSNASDSEIEIIGREAFYDNEYRNSSPSPHPQMAKYGNQNVSNRMNLVPPPSQTYVLPGSHPRLAFGASGNVLHARPQGYGSFGSLPGSIGRYPGQASGSMHDSGPVLGYTMNGSAADGLGNGYNNQASPFGTPVGTYGLNPYSPLQHFNRPLNPAMGDQYDYIMNDPRKTNDEIKTLLENIRPDVDLPLEDREGTPDGLVYPLVSRNVMISKFVLTARSMNIKRLL